MNWVRLGVVAAALSLASYAWAAGPEGGLGAPAPKVTGGKPKASLPLPKAPLAPSDSLGRYAHALDRLKPDGAAATRGARETGVYQKASPAVVLIITKDGLGSGVLVGADGKIVTNLHVVGDNTEVGVIFKPAIEGAQVEKGDIRRGRVLRRDEVADLALVQVAEVPPGVTPLQLGDSTAIQVGADVHAIGHPTGEAWTYTKGIVSQVRRAYAWTNREENIPHEATVIQTQTPINPGNSGGPLLDDNLKVVGINSFKGDGEGLNFAVSAEDVKTFLARGGDRLAPEAPRKQASAAPCRKSEALRVEHDDKEGGTYAAMDETCDGKVDYVAFVPDDKRKPVEMLYDDDGDGKVETILFDSDRDGLPDRGLYDTNGDGDRKSVV